jgi:hypothetical protein
MLVLGEQLPAGPRRLVIDAVSAFGPGSNETVRLNRVRQAAYLIFASPQYQIIR